VTRIDLSSLFASIGIKRDYSALDLDGLSPDLQGWGAEHPIFERVLLDVRPRVVIEVGTWKGASVLHMQALAREHGLGTAFICIDTWLGSAEHWSKPEPREHFRVEGGFPTLYREFIVNVIASNAVSDIYPVPIPSSAGARLLNKLGVTAEVIYLDAAHEEEEVALDLSLYWALVEPGGVFFGHDYTGRWIGVMRAVDHFCAERELELEVEHQWWIVRKPPAPAPDMGAG
jgi:hypothetical protein